MSKVIPGQYITPIHKVEDGEVKRYISGKGTTINEIEVENEKIPIIVGTILGRVIIKLTGDNEYIVSVIPKNQPEVEDLKSTNNLPKENDIVLVRITRINQRQANCEILTIEGSGNIINDSGIGTNGELAHLSIGYGGGSQSLSNHSTIASSQTSMINAMSIDVGENFKGIIRSQDVRSTERDKIKIQECFKPGDIVRAIIISLGDGSNYYLSTANNELGVIYSKSDGGAGNPMFPIDWQHMITENGNIEMRKCAKPLQ
ncbi:exosome complex component Csl4p [[Candida] jaroonii]|uniref:Exosome complex component Csl4p n=1 Tax=[Candida] jaroonii TaxID=467808 RepID=A0ACA9Y944_9ASCO|nr:exosome complex component Csl4p [[Candida] jaroonii]